MLLIPWTETGSLSEAPMVSKNTMEYKLRSDAHSNFVAEALDKTKCTTAVFINNAFSGSLENSPIALTRRLIAKTGRGPNAATIADLPPVDRSHHIFMPFFGGADGQAAVRLAMQLAENEEITLTLVHYQIRSEGDPLPAVTKEDLPEGIIRVSSSLIAMTSDIDFFATLRHTLPEDFQTRVTFRSTISYDPVQDAVDDAVNEVGRNDGNGGDIVMLGRNVEIVDSPNASCLGLVADVMIERELKASLIVVQGRKD